ncbi:sensor histidine kinase [Jiangella mangrovi]|uniref:histidine kinase n=1 Tax=Jiangella mangrovi TaxID=1524084 RepID=A0A7W9GVL1_9ACTN|nr:sensor histidine kinase [Jiangella mangrovi]MBB5790553.1 signal transduction histidine kinase [Jiangella mangrovi]
MSDEATRPRVTWRQIGRDLGYLVPGMPIAVFSFALMITGFFLGVGLIVLAFVGLIILAATLLTGRWFARVERGRVGLMERRSVGPVYYQPPRERGLSRVLEILRDRQTWRDWLYNVLILPVRVFTWSVTIIWLGFAIGLSPLILLSWAIAGGGGFRGLPLAMAHILRGVAALESSLAWGLLTNETAALRARTEELSRSRQSVVAAEAEMLRRVERDIHDGPQQRLVRLTMDLESAQRRFDDDPQAARPLVEEAVLQTKEALAELRAVSRGIAPPILTDRGLPAALAAATARCPVPTTLDVDLLDGERLPAAVENAAYFVVTESLTNVAKHSDASSCAVSVLRVEDVLHVQVTDDGRGGAHLGKGHGLAGLADRLAGVDGRLDVASPPGAGTTVSASLPLVD